MKPTTLVPAAVLLSLASFLAYSAALAQTRPSASAKIDTYAVDSVHSSIIFRIQHMGVSYFYGRINGPAGKFAFSPDDPAACSFEITAKAENVDSGNAKRDDHLKSGDFFNAKQFPDITFKSKSVRKRGEGAYQVTGDLSLHGVTRAITVDLDHVGCATDSRGTARCGFDTAFAIKRSEFGMDFMQGPLGDEVRLMVGIEGVRQ